MNSVKILPSYFTHINVCYAAVAWAVCSISEMNGIFHSAYQKLSASLHGANQSTHGSVQKNNT